MTAAEKRLLRWMAVLALSFAAAATLPAPPASGSAAGEEAGATLFREKGCAYCHGAATEGTSRGPSLVDIRKRWKAGQIADQIVNGGQKMPAFKDALSPQEVTQVVQFLRAKDRPAPPPAKVPQSLSNPAQ